jgi:hypothetical protein
MDKAAIKGHGVLRGDSGGVFAVGKPVSVFLGQMIS